MTAEKPIGPNRFLPTKPVASWTAPLEATKVGSVCAQLPANALVNLPVLPGSEDCLYLNIWAPTDTTGNLRSRSKPILIFLHGGGFVGGSGYTEMNCAFYDGQGLAADVNAVVSAAALCLVLTVLLAGRHVKLSRRRVWMDG